METVLWSLCCGACAGCWGKAWFCCWYNATPGDGGWKGESGGFEYGEFLDPGLGIERTTIWRDWGCWLENLAWPPYEACW